MDPIEQATAEAVLYLIGSGCPFPAGAKAGIVAHNWAIAFCDLSPEALRVAARLHTRGERAQFWPTAHELRSYVTPPEEDWVALFGVVMKLISQGKAGQPAHASPAIAEAARQWVISEGGSSVLGQMETRDRPHRQRSFVEYMTKAARNAEMSARIAQVSAAGPRLLGAP